MERVSYQPKMTRKLSGMASTTNHFKVATQNFGTERKIDSFYDKILDNDTLNLIGNQKSTLVLAMQTINAVRKKYK